MTLPTPIENPPAELADQLRADAGRGVSTRPEDQLIPLVYVLQTGSPQCDKRGSGYVDGAEPGHFLLRGAIDPVRDGKEGIVVIPCGMIRAWTEWLPGRQGLVGRHDQVPNDVETRTIKDGSYERQSLVRSDSGNIIQDTREYYILVDGAPYMLPCYGTKHTFARQWQSYFGQIKDPRSGVILPSYSRRYRLTTVSAANAMGKWFAIRFQDQGWIAAAELQAARALADLAERGALRAELPLSETGGTARLSHDGQASAA